MSSKIVKAATWTLSGQMVKLLIRLLTNIVLARLLTPKEFGLMGMVTVIVTLLTSLSELGLFSSLIQKKNVTQKDLSSVFWLSVILGLIIFMGLCLCAPLVVMFFHEEALLNVVRFLSINFFFNSFILTHNAILTKSLNFNRMEAYSTVSVIVSSLVGLLLAYFNYGVWALVAVQNIYSLLNVALIWIFEKWRPSFIISKQSLKELLGFGIKVFASAVLDTFFRSLDLLIIGRYFSVTILGLYTFSQTLIYAPITLLTGALVKVLFPVMAEAQNDNERLRSTYKRAINLVNVMIIPLMFTVAIFASDIVLLLLDYKWINMVPYIRFMAIIAILYPLSALNINILLAKGYADKFLRLEVIKKALFVAGIGLGLFFGIYGMLWGILISSLIGVIFNLYVSGKISQYYLVQQLNDLKPIIFLSLIYLVVLYITLYLFSMWIPGIIAMILSFTVSAGLLLRLMFKFQPEIIIEIRTILQGFIKKSA